MLPLRGARQSIILEMSLAPPEALGPLRRERLRTARLYFVCDARPRGEDPEPLLRAALAGGVDIVQLREKSLPPGEIEVAALTFRRLCDTYSALFIVNDDPELARSCDADGVHVGQDDSPAAEAREVLGPDAIIGLSTHSEEQLGGIGHRCRSTTSASARSGRPRRKRAGPGSGWSSSPTPRAGAPIPSLRSAASTPPTRPGSSRPGPRGSAWSARSATPRTRPRRRKSCARRWVPARWRPVAERQKRKDRSAEGRGAGMPGADGERLREGRGAQPGSARGTRAARRRGASRGGHVGAAISALIAISVLVGYLSGVEVDGDRPRLAQVLAPALLMGVMAWGMWRARYWAVLGFQLVLVFLIFAAVSGIAIQASSVGDFADYLVLLGIAGTLFIFMVKAMARIQMPQRK